mmetsp:Transcript_71713/g.149689  ORF Transcript_71713/g.149689 Transcript_71713/m.149689 type:complete len:84 (+) Transcript_71713:1328-1579(+)
MNDLVHISEIIASAANIQKVTSVIGMGSSNFDAVLDADDCFVAAVVEKLEGDERQKECGNQESGGKAEGRAHLGRQLKRRSPI